LFKEYGNIKDIRLPIDRATGQLKGLAFLEFEHASSVEKALVKDGF
jgi:RNA recognition motif-containing protein